jgi:SAM-dependent methyltransferase
VSLHTTTDLSHLRERSNTYDLIVSTAAIHHHAFLEPVFAAIASALRPQGYLAIADWHNHLSTHPAHLLPLLHSIEWPNKELDIKAFQHRFDCDPPSIVDPLAVKANQQISDFWIAYGKGCGDIQGRFIVLEGHRPLIEYIEQIESSGLKLLRSTSTGLSNPRLLFPDSSLLVLTIAHKA